MGPNVLDSDGAEGNGPNRSRRQLLGLFAAASTVGVGSVYGLASMTRRAAAAANVTFEDGSVVLGPDEELSGVTVSGTVEASYDAGGDDVATASMTARLTDPDGDLSTPDARQFDYDDVDADAGAVSRDVSFALDLSDDFADPSPGQANETELSLAVLFGVERAEPEDGGFVIVETRASDSAVLRVERESRDNGPTQNPTSQRTTTQNSTTREPTVDVGATFTFDFETSSEDAPSNASRGGNQSGRGREGAGREGAGRGRGN